MGSPQVTWDDQAQDRPRKVRWDDEKPPSIDDEKQSSGPVRLVKGLLTPSARMMAHPFGMEQPALPPATDEELRRGFTWQDFTKSLHGFTPSKLGTAVGESLWNEAKTLNPITVDRFKSGDWMGGIGESASNIGLLRSAFRDTRPVKALDAGVKAATRAAIPKPIVAGVDAAREAWRNYEPMRAPVAAPVEPIEGEYVESPPIEAEPGPPFAENIPRTNRMLPASASPAKEGLYRYGLGVIPPEQVGPEVASAPNFVRVRGQLGAPQAEPVPAPYRYRPGEIASEQVGAPSPPNFVRIRGQLPAAASSLGIEPVPSGSTIPRTPAGESVLNQALTALDNKTLLKVARSRGIDVTSESQLKPGVGDQRIIKKILDDFSPEELEEVRNRGLEASRHTPVDRNLEPEQGRELWHAKVLQTFFPDVQMPKAMQARVNKAMALGPVPREAIEAPAIEQKVPAQTEHVPAIEAQPTPRSQQIGSATVAQNDNALFQQAKTELGPEASVSQIALRAEELKRSAAQPSKKVPLGGTPKPSGEDELEAARRGAEGEPTESIENQVPFEKRASTQMAAAQNQTGLAPRQVSTGIGLGEQPAVPAPGEDLAPALQRSVELAKAQRVGLGKSPEVSEPKRNPLGVPSAEPQTPVQPGISLERAAKPRHLTDTPFTRDDVERFNRFTHFPKKLETENQRFAEESHSEEQYARERLTKYGVEDIPDDVQTALDRLKQARYDLTMRSIRSREVAPPWSVVGPARYNEHANPKRAESIMQKGFDQFNEAKARLDRVLRQHGPSRIISSDQADTVEQLETKIKQAEQFQDTMKQSNAIIRKKALTDEQKVEQLVDLGIDSGRAWQLLKPDFAGRLGFPDYATKNNAGNIRRMRERVEQISRERGTQTNETAFDGGKVIDSAEDNRVQIFFDSKPPAQTIAKLKSSGFHWSPSIGAWQRQRTNSARYAAQTITGVKLSEAESAAAEPENKALGMPSAAQNPNYEDWVAGGRKPLAGGKPKQEAPEPIEKPQAENPTEAIKNFDNAVESTGAEVKAGQPSREFQAKIKKAIELTPENDAALKEKHQGAAYQREYFKAALQQASDAWKDVTKNAPAVEFGKQTTRNGRKEITVYLADKPGVRLKLQTNSNGEWSVSYEGYAQSKHGIQQVTQQLTPYREGVSLQTAKSVAESRLRTGNLYNEDEPFLWPNGTEYNGKPQDSNHNPAMPKGMDSAQLYIKVPGDGHFLVNNNPAAIEKALAGADKGFTPVKAESPTSRTPRSPKEFDNEKYIGQLEKEIAALNDEKRLHHRDSWQGQYIDEQIRAAQENLREAKSSNH